MPLIAMRPSAVTASVRFIPVLLIVMTGIVQAAESATTTNGKADEGLLSTRIDIDVVRCPLMHALQACRKAVQRQGRTIEILVPYDTAYDDRPVTVHGEHDTVRNTLDGIARTCGLRWFEQAGSVLIDRPADHPQALVEPVVSAKDSVTAFEATRCALQAGDLAALRSIMLLLADDHADRNAGIVAALREYVPLILPCSRQPAFLVDDRVRAALAAHWSRIEACSATPFDCWLMGAAGVQEALPQLRLILADPCRVRVELADEPSPFLLREGMRASAAYALGRLGDAASLGAIGTFATQGGHPLTDHAAIEALRASHRPETVPFLKAFWSRSRDDLAGGGGWRRRGALYAAAYELDPALIASMFAEQDAVSGSGASIDLWASHWEKDPVALVVPALIAALDEKPSPHLVDAFLRGCEGLPAEALRPLIAEGIQAAEHPTARIVLLIADACAGNRSSWETALNLYLADPDVTVSGKVIAAPLMYRRDDGRVASLVGEAGTVGSWNDRVVSVLAFVHQDVADHLLIEKFGDFPQALQATVEDGLRQSAEPAAIAFRQRRLADGGSARTSLGSTRQEFDHALSLLDTMKAEPRSDLFLALVQDCFMSNSRYGRLLDFLSASRDRAFLARTLPNLYANYAAQSVVPAAQTSRLAEVLIRSAGGDDREVRLAALSAMLRWAHDNGPYKTTFIDIMRRAQEDSDAQIGKTANNALQNYTSWYIGGNQSSNSWITLLRGESDDLKRLKEIQRLLVGEDSPPAEVPAASAAGF
jgi:hypothetical protein